MAAQKLTRGRFVQIIIMLSILIGAFIWRTVEHQSTINVTCNLDEECAFFVNNSRFTAQVSQQNIQVKTDENNWIMKANSGQITPVTKNNTWLIEFTPQTGSISFILSMENETIDRPVNIQIN